MDKQQYLKNVGDISQICYAKRYRSIGGRDDGVIYIQIQTGSGLSFTIVESRGLDISNAEFKGVNIAFISKNKITSPYLFEEMNQGFERSFYGGLLSTCGMSYHGAKSQDDNQYRGTHGRYNNTPAEDVSILQEWIDNRYLIRVTGFVRETSLFGESTLLKRTIETELYSSQIMISDEIINQSFHPQPLMLLYHINLGYPLLSENAVFSKSDSTVRPRDHVASDGIEQFHQFSKPIKDFREQVFYHENFVNDLSYGQLYNPDFNLTFRVDFPVFISVGNYFE